MRSVPWVGERIHQKIAEKEPALTALFLLRQASQGLAI